MDTLSLEERRMPLEKESKESSRNVLAQRAFWEDETQESGRIFLRRTSRNMPVTYFSVRYCETRERRVMKFIYIDKNGA